MFSRFVSITLKPNAAQEFTDVLANTILPILREQRGFRDELLFTTGGPEVLAVSIWDSKDDADKFAKAAYPDILSSLSNLIEGTPTVQTHLLAFSTAHEIELGKAPVQSPITTPVAGVGG